MKERTLVIIKPDAINRSLIGEIIHRFEAKGLKIVGMKLVHLSEKELEIHYAHHKGKKFFPGLIRYMRSAPSLLIVLEGNDVVSVVRKMAGPTYGVEAEPGTIRGDFSMSMQNTIIHASDSVEKAEEEIKRFFKPEEIFEYNRVDSNYIYSEEER
ncbi:MAG: nucleoside-diphosphate kinase [Candidatus Woesearchaeota archaeon]|nr:nucleoside-diphosphate kinase [Candidatus Woesearchaeota archaeon]